MGKEQVGHADLVGGEQTDLHSHGISFLDHVDTPLDYTGAAGKFVKVNAAPDGLIFESLAAGDLPAHAHARANISDFWGEPFWASIPDKPSTFPPSAHTLASHSSKPHSELSDAPANAHHPQTHTLASHTSKDHHLLAGLGDDDHSIYYNSARHTKAVHTSLGLMPYSGGTFTGHVYARDHGSAATDSIINVCYGTGNPPAANTTTIGTLFVKYTA